MPLYIQQLGIRTPQRLHRLQRIGGNALAQLLQRFAQSLDRQGCGIGAVDCFNPIDGNRPQARPARIKAQGCAISAAAYPGRLESSPALGIVQHQGSAAGIEALQPDSAFQQATLALDQALTQHPPIVADGLATGLYFGLVHGPAQGSHDVGLHLGAQRVTPLHRVHQQLPMAKLHQQVTRPVRVAVHQLPGFPDTRGHARGLSIHHACRHGVPVLARLAVAGLIGQAGAHHVLHP